MRIGVVARVALALLLLGTGALACAVAFTFFVAFVSAQGFDALIWLALGSASVAGIAVCIYAIRRVRSLSLWKLGVAGCIAFVSALPGYSLLHAFAMNPP